MLLLAVMFVGFTALGIHDLRQNEHKLQLNEIRLQDSLLEMNHLRLEKEKLNKQFEEAINEKDINIERVQELEREKLELEERTRQLERDLQAKKERTIASAGVSQRASAQTITGNKESWLRASGIPESEWWAVDVLIHKESSWNPNAVNPSSGACGLGQQLPCGKWAHTWNEPIGALKDAHQYVLARYGSWANALDFHKRNNWY